MEYPFDFRCTACDLIITRDYAEGQPIPACHICGGELRPRLYHCHRCGLPIKPGNETMLEFNNYTGEYLPEGAPPVSPPEDSLGGFLFGPECKNKPNAPFNSALRERNLERS